MFKLFDNVLGKQKNESIFEIKKWIKQHTIRLASWAVGHLAGVAVLNVCAVKKIRSFTERALRRGARSTVSATVHTNITGWNEILVTQTVFVATRIRNAKCVSRFAGYAG